MSTGRRSFVRALAAGGAVWIVSGSGGAAWEGRPGSFRVVDAKTLRPIAAFLEGRGIDERRAQEAGRV